MLRTATVHCIPYHAGVCTRALPPVAHRTFVSGFPRLNALTGKKATEPASKGVEGLHKREFYLLRWTSALKAEVHIGDKTPTPPANQEGSAGVGVPSVVKGDWVLFHPVYTADELRSVDVSVFYNAVQGEPSLLQ